MTYDIGEWYQVKVDDHWLKVRLIGLTITGLAVFQQPEWTGGAICMARATPDNENVREFDNFHLLP